jgi:uncharacterized protein
VLSASRASAIAARLMGIPSFLIGDYEHAHVRVFRLTGSTIMHPDVIDQDVLCSRGMRRDQLVAFRGIKEDLTFAETDVEAVEPHDLGCPPQPPVRILFRPPAETSHYYRASSSEYARATLEHLAGLDALVVFSPRDPAQVRLLEGLPWRHEPLVLERPVPFISLLKSIDLVVCSGGTMLREAAYLGIPAYGIFQGEIGAVDRWLQDIGRAHLLSNPEDLARIELVRRGSLKRLDSNPDLLGELASLIAARASRTSGQRRRVRQRRRVTV